MTPDDYDRTDPANWFDHHYWGPEGVDISQWGPQCQRGLRYRDTGAPQPAGTPGQRRSFGGSRKARGSSADSLAAAEARKDVKP